jgi:N-acetyl-gamma-glutamylphosphate reductase
MKIKAIITGATGMVGEGVLQECLVHPDVEKVLVINRRPSPALRMLMPKFVSTLREVAVGMINAVVIGSDKAVLEVSDIVELSKK